MLVVVGRAGAELAGVRDVVDQLLLHLLGGVVLGAADVHSHSHAEFLTVDTSKNNF